MGHPFYIHPFYIHSFDSHPIDIRRFVDQAPVIYPLLFVSLGLNGLSALIFGRKA